MGIRNTFEAEDTPLGILHLQRSFGNNIMYPNCFISYTGEALDYKTPLLRALQVMDEADVCKYFDKNVKKVLLL
jgi:glutamine synthetase